MTETLRESVKAAYDEVVNNAVPETETEETEPEQAEDQQDPPSPPEPEIEAPSHWANDDREAFKSLDKKGREFLLRRHKEMEADYTRKNQAHADILKKAEGLQKVLEPHDAYIRKIGFEPSQVIDKLLGAEIRLRMGSPAEKRAIIKQLSQEYGIPLDDNATQPEVDQQTQIILQKIDETERTVLQLKKEREAEERRALQNHIDNFSSQVDEKGLPKYPHFETVKARMGKFLKDGEAASMEDAYEKAIFLNKDLRDEYLLRQNKIEAKKKVVASKDASFNVKSDSTSMMSDSRPDETIRQTLKRVIGEQKTKRI